MGSEVHFDNFHKKLQTRTGVLETFFGDEVWAKKHPKQYKKLNLGYKVNTVLAVYILISEFPEKVPTHFTKISSEIIKLNRTQCTAM